MAHAQSICGGGGGGEGELHLVTATAAVYSLKIFECSELVTAKTG